MASFNLSNTTILLVDDVQFSRVTLSSMLRDMGDPDMYQAADGNEALSVFNSLEKVDLVISDFNMPVKDGLWLLKAVRTSKNKDRRSTPFAMLTGHSDKHLVDIALALDVNAFLIKPISKAALQARLDYMLARVAVEEWLKSVEDYKSVNLTSVAMKTAHQPTTDARSVFIQGRNAPLFKTDKMLLDENKERTEAALQKLQASLPTV
jgi:CheY-like chemotaxis protein